MDVLKTCRHCHEEKSLTEFPIGARYKDGHQNRCKSCKNAYNKERRANGAYRLSERRLSLKRKYSLTVEAAERIYARGCEACGSTDDLCIDHDHTSGKVRGCLCGKCNKALGLLRDDLTVILGLADYLKNYVEVTDA